MGMQSCYNEIMLEHEEPSDRPVRPNVEDLRAAETNDEVATVNECAVELPTENGQDEASPMSDTAQDQLGAAAAVESSISILPTELERSSLISASTEMRELI